MKVAVYIKTKKRALVLREIKRGMKRSKERDEINKELFRQGIWNFRYGIKGLSI
jgi:hypothetical protein